MTEETPAEALQKLDVLSMPPVDSTNLPSFTEMCDCLLFMAQSMMTIRQNLLRMNAVQTQLNLSPERTPSVNGLMSNFNQPAELLSLLNVTNDDEDNTKIKAPDLASFKIPMIKDEQMDSAEEEESQIGKFPYKCQDCGRHFRNRFLLKKHISTHSGEKPFSCGLCNKAFNRKDNMRRHMKLPHPGASEMTIKIEPMAEPSEISTESISPLAGSNGVRNTVERLLSMLVGSKKEEPVVEVTC